jgi:CelD/BcsL family acetyltransferase involved in cellulose biosynthesis
MQTISTLNKLAALRSEWTALWRADAGATPFQSPAWLLPWARHFAPDRVRALALREGGYLIALLPFFTWQGKLLLAGTGPSDYADALFAPDAIARAAQLLAGVCAAAQELGCDGIDLQQLRPTSPLLDAATPPGWTSQISDGEICPVAAGPSVQRRKNLDYALRALRREAEANFGLVGADELDAALARIAALHAQRWGEREQSGIFADPRMHAFVREASAALAAAGLLHLHVLRIAGEIAAAALVMQGHAARYLYLCTFDTHWARRSPGALNVDAAMRDAAQAGAREFHFLRGREAYKYQFGAIDTPTFQRRLLRAA